VSMLILSASVNASETPMADTIKTGAILIKEGTPLPEALRLETESFLNGWTLVKNLDGYGLDRKIYGEGWTFFCIAEEIRATVFGIDVQRMVRRAIERILRDPKSERFNSLGITQVASGRFLGIRYVTVSANLRHIQESLNFFRAKGLRELGPTGIDCRPNQSRGLVGGTDLPLQETMRAPNLATILNL
jgi:hypothetical protein